MVTAGGYNTPGGEDREGAAAAELAEAGGTARRASGIPPPPPPPPRADAPADPLEDVQPRFLDRDGPSYDGGRGGFDDDDLNLGVGFGSNRTERGTRDRSSNTAGRSLGRASHGGRRFSDVMELHGLTSGVTNDRGRRESSAADIQAHGRSSLFTRDFDVDDDDLLDVDVILLKADYGVPGSSDYRKNMALATVALAEKFGVARHKVVSATGEADSGDQAKSQHVQQVLVGILHRVNEGQERASAMDWIDISLVAALSSSPDDLEDEDSRKWWNFSAPRKNIWTDWDSLTLDWVLAWQYTINKRSSAGDRIASHWLRIFVYNSSSDSLRDAVKKKYDRIERNCRGGILYLFLTLEEMFTMSREVREAMLLFLDLFRRKGIARYSGENVMIVRNELVGICKRLHVAKALTEEHVFDILTGLAIVTNTRFRKMFEHLKESADLGNVVILPTIKEDFDPMERIEAILDKAVDTYDKLSTAQLWNKTTKGGPHAGAAAGGLPTCWNCGKPGCSVRNCPQPLDQAKIAKAKKEWWERRNSRQSGGGGGGTNGGRPAKPSGSGPDYQRKVWEASGIHLVDNVLMIKCKKCGLNCTHGTKHHSSYMANKASFKLPDDHPYVRECAKRNQGKTPSGGVPGTVGTGGSSQGSGSSGFRLTDSTGSGGDMIQISRSALERKVDTFERESTDPNAASMAAAFRNIWLN